METRGQPSLENWGGGVDILTAGWPCQDLSVAGLRAGLAGERSGLFREVVRFAEALRPPWLVCENVPGLLSSWSPAEPPPGGVDAGAEWEVEETSDFETVLGSLAELGYLGVWRVLDAQWYGVPQQRRRVFIAGCLGAERLAALLDLLHSGSGDPAPRREAPEEPARTVTAGYADNRGATAGNNGGVVNLIAVSESGPGWWADGIGPIRAEGQRPARPSELIAIQCHGSDVGNLGTLRAGHGDVQSGVPVVARELNAFGGGSAGRYEPSSETFIVEGDSAASTPALPRPRAGCGRGGETYVMRSSQTGANGDNLWRDRSCTLGTDQEPAPIVAHTLTGEYDASEDGTGRGVPLVAATVGADHRPASDHHRRNLVDEGMPVRRMTPTEYERLQGMPEGWTCLCGRNQGRSWPEEAACICADGPRYRALGNGLALPVAIWVLRHVQAAERSLA